MARNFGVIGSPIGHSKSPALHRAAITALGIDASYGLTDVTDKELETYVKGLDQSWEGLSLTMPLKQAVRPLLSRQCHLSVLTGSVNTIVRRTNGWHGFNTDVWGATTAIRESFGGEFERAILLGAGATAAGFSALGAAGLGGDPARAAPGASQPAKARSRTRVRVGMGSPVGARD